PADQTAALLLNATTGNLGTVAASLTASVAATPEQKAADAARAVHEELNLTAATVVAVASQLSKPPAALGTPGPFVSVRRFAYTDANNYSYTVFTGDSSKTDANGEYVANEVRQTIAGGADVPFNRNQVYWTGSEWKTCALQWEVITHNKTPTATTAGHSLYCGASKSESRVAVEDIAGRKLRDVIAQIRGSALADSLGAHTDPVSGLPTRWGPDPALLPADATFPAGSQLSLRTTHADIGGTDRIELTNKSSVRWADGRFRQAVALEQYSGMPGDLKDAAAIISFSNVVYVNDLPLADQPDATLDAFKRYVAGLDVEALKIRFYKCDSRKADQVLVNCAAAGDGTLAIGTQGDARLLRVASGYPAELESRIKTRRFWIERNGAVFRGAHDLEHTRYDQRLNAPAWTALRAALGIPAHTEPVAPVAFGPFSSMRNFTFSDAGNYSLRTFDGDSSVQDAQGFYIANEVRRIKSGGNAVAFARNALYWTGTEWYDCPSDGVGINIVDSKAPFDSTYCKSYLDERVSEVTLTLAGRRMSDVVNDIRRYGSKDFNFDYGNWGPNPGAHPELAASFFPAGATMGYRTSLRKATPIAISTAATSRVRVAPADASVPFDTWPFATSMDNFIAKYPGDLLAGPLNGSTAFWVHGYTLPAAPSPAYTTQIEIRVAFDANGNKARFWQNNRAVTTGFTTNYVKLLDTTYTVETLGGVKVLKFAALPDGFERDFLFARMFAEKDGSVWYAFKDTVPAGPVYSVRMNGSAFGALRTALGIGE
ncbi:MAG TPA: hypothetical protein VKI18_06965, partial [Albitalea sp.]|nr:hypothetical protein [Albitalea sp.]